MTTSKNLMTWQESREEEHPGTFPLGEVCFFACN